MAGEIHDLVVHPRYMLQKSFIYHGHIERAIYYCADFQYSEIPGIVVIEEIKGFETEAWKIKRKLFLYLYPTVDFRVIR
jgi:hypothetical protein